MLGAIYLTKELGSYTLPTQLPSACFYKVLLVYGYTHLFVHSLCLFFLHCVTKNQNSHNKDLKSGRQNIMSAPVEKASVSPVHGKM